jgi:hypothetical protein
VARGFEDQADAGGDEMNEREQAKLEIMRACCRRHSDDCPDDDVDCYECPHKTGIADLVLSLKGDGWRIAVVREKGELPRVEQPTRNYTDVNFGYQLAQQDMLDEGWVQGVK